ncbi:hypothetical protein M3Y97_00925700 [Aphelenchoides bicaudatus]|nr:hypothetical protein M3Y97_00925700 [Aphelenchoides bicaudatus]
MAELEKELQYYKEMYEIEKETNELNEIKLKELDSLNAQDKQKYERELTDWKLKYRKLETSQSTQKTNETASQALRQRIRQLENEITSLTDRVRIAENSATKLEEDCRAKEFKIKEQQKDYEICLSKCNALELMLMTQSQMDGSISLGQSMCADVSEPTCESPNGKVLNFGEYAVDKHCSPNTDTTCDTAPQSPSLVENNKEALNGFSNDTPTALPNKTAKLNGKTDHKNGSETAENFPNFSNFLELDKARAYCQTNQNDVESLLKFADMVRAVRMADDDTFAAKPSRRSETSATGRIPLAVMSGMDYLRDLQRHFSELTSPKQCSRIGSLIFVCNLPVVCHLYFVLLNQKNIFVAFRILDLSIQVHFFCFMYTNK